MFLAIIIGARNLDPQCNCNYKLPLDAFEIMYSNQL